MNVHEYQQWVSEFYQERGWYELHPFIRVNYLSEETGEVARAIRTLEIGRDRPDEIEASKEEQLENLVEELGDVLDNIFILADKYNVSLEEIMSKHREKLEKRFS